MQRQITPMMAGHPPTQAQREQDEDGLVTTPLHIAAHCGDEAALERMLSSGTPVEARDQEGQTALHVAASREHRSTSARKQTASETSVLALISTVSYRSSQSAKSSAADLRRRSRARCCGF